MLFQRYGDSLTAGQIREYLKDHPDHAPVQLDGGDDWSDGHELYTIKPKEFYMLSRDSLSRRLGPVFAEVAALATRGGKPGLARALEMAKAGPQMAAIKVPAKAYKPAHGATQHDHLH